MALLLCASVGATLLSVRYYFSLKELQKLQAQNLQIKQTMAAVQALALDCVRYGQQNPTINPILKEFKIQTTETAANQALPSDPSLNQ